MKHYSTPDNKESIENPDLSHFSNHCVDELHIKWEFDDNVLKMAKWDGIGCAVFQSSSDIFLNIIKNKNKDEIKKVALEYEKLINQSNEEIDLELIGDLQVFKNVKKQLNRLNCANMVSQAILKNIT